MFPKFVGAIGEDLRKIKSPGKTTFAWVEVDLLEEAETKAKNVKATHEKLRRLSTHEREQRLLSCSQSGRFGAVLLSIR